MTGADCLRIHIRADSNESTAQQIKYAVRDDVVDYLMPLACRYASAEEAADGLRLRLDEIERVATETLRENGFVYGVTASVERAYFPTRVYDEYTLPSGEYTALILRLGSGKGDNWWCVVYPPLCFLTAQTDVVYKSKLVEIISAWKNAHTA